MENAQMFADLRAKVEKIRKSMKEAVSTLETVEQFITRYEDATRLLVGNISTAAKAQSKVEVVSATTKNSGDGIPWKEKILKFLEGGKKLSTPDLWQQFVQAGLVKDGPTSATFRTTLFILHKKKHVLSQEIDEKGRKLWSIKTK